MNQPYGNRSYVKVFIIFFSLLFKKRKYNKMIKKNRDFFFHKSCCAWIFGRYMRKKFSKKSRLITNASTNFDDNDDDHDGRLWPTFSILNHTASSDFFLFFILSFLCCHYYYFFIYIFTFYLIYFIFIHVGLIHPHVNTLKNHHPIYPHKSYLVWRLKILPGSTKGNYI